ncbi:MAG: hypothetical protein WCG44_03880 [bacterium]
MTKQQGLLTETDLIKIGNLIDARLEVKLDQKFDEKLASFATKADLTQLRQDMLGDKSEILGAINKNEENEAGHKMLHENLGEDVPKLQQQVKHLFKTFEIVDPTEVVPSY